MHERWRAGALPHAKPHLQRKRQRIAKWSDKWSKGRLPPISNGTTCTGKIILF